MAGKGKKLSIFYYLVTAFVLISTVTTPPSSLKTIAVCIAAVGWILKAGIDIYTLLKEKKK